MAERLIEYLPCDRFASALSPAVPDAGADEPDADEGEHREGGGFGENHEANVDEMIFPVDFSIYLQVGCRASPSFVTRYVLK